MTLDGHRFILGSEVLPLENHTSVNLSLKATRGISIKVHVKLTQTIYSPAQVCVIFFITSALSLSPVTWRLGTCQTMPLRQ